MKMWLTGLCGIPLYLCLVWSPLLRITFAQEIPNCPFVDTVNISDGLKLSNDSYLYQGVVVPPQLIGIYDYHLIHGGQRVPVEAHLRGCVCQLKSCVKFCCHPREIKVDFSWECERDDDLQYSPLINVTLNNGSRQIVHVLDEFVVQQGIPCHDGYALTPELSEADGWQLFENGSLLRMYDMAWLSKTEYCLTPNENNGSFILSPINCPIYKEKSSRELVNIITMFISIPFLVLTICVYVWIPELRNLPGKCIICYLVALTLGYTMLVVVSFENHDEPYSLQLCKFLGYIGTCSFLAAFFWLSVISFDLWYNFHVAQGACNRFLERKTLFMYSIYAWGIPIILSILAVVAQSSDLDETLKPGFGIKYCWLNHNLWSPMIYFYGPILLLMLFNLMMFILTAMKIYRVQRELARMVELEESTKHLNNQKDTFFLFLRLFIVMGVTWLLEVFSYMVGVDNIWSSFFWIPDICNSAQGVIIFVLFVFKRKVKLLMIKRIRGRQMTSSRSGSTHSELPEEMSLQDNAKE